MDVHYTCTTTNSEPNTATTTITLGRSSLHSILINQHQHTSSTRNADPFLDERTSSSTGLTQFSKMQGVEEVLDDEDAMSVSPAAVHFHPAMPRPTRESVLQRLSEALLRRSLAKVRRKERARMWIACDGETLDLCAHTLQTFDLLFIFSLIFLSAAWCLRMHGWSKWRYFRTNI
jgi:hypothetical protein